MPSITFWNHLEPRPDAALNSERGLAAEVRDPLWMLTRQWQLGEFLAEDAGSPAHVDVETDRWTLEGWRSADGLLHPLAAGQSLEEQMLGETVPGTDLLTRVELGQVFEHLLSDALPESALRGPESVVDGFRREFPLRDTAVAAADRTRDVYEFLALCGGRCVDGLTLWQNLVTGRGAWGAAYVPIKVDAAHLTGVQAAQEQFLAWVREVFGELAERDPPTWVPGELDFRGGLVTGPLAGGQVEFGVHPGLRGEVESYSLDAPSTTPRVPERGTNCRMMPGHLRVRGMPNARFWDFENEPQDWGPVEAEPRDLARLAFLETVLTQGNDWFLVPLRMDVGSVCRVRSLRVTDVFGVVIDVPRAETLSATPTRRWRMFGHVSGDAEDPGLRVLLPESTRGMVASPPLEEVRFLRDEMANLLWSVERTYAGPFGEPVNARDAVAIRAAEAPPSTELAAAPAAGEPRLSYQLQTTVPASWVPWVAVRVSPLEGDVALELSRMGTEETPLRARVLQPAITPPYRIPEFLVPRSGLRVLREYVKTREPDGTSRLWIRRHRGPGQGEGDSGLQYDRVMDR
jgi:hypothetical protein